MRIYFYVALGVGRQWPNTTLSLYSAGFKNRTVIYVEEMLKALLAAFQRYSVDIVQTDVTEVKLELVCETENRTTECGADSKKVLKPFSLRFKTLPPHGTRLRAWHHPAAALNDETHQDERRIVR